MTNAEREAATATALVAAAKMGDQRAFEALVKRYRKRIYALALHMTRSASEADDIAQEVFLKAFRALPTFRGGADPGTWLYRIVYNTCLDAIRSDRRHAAERFTDDEADRGSTSASEQGAEEQLTDRSMLASAFDNLAEDHKTVVWLIDVEGFDYNAAAEVFGIAPGTVGSRLFRAHAQLRAAMGGER